MTPSPEQIKQALVNARQAPVTRGVRLRASLVHVRQSKEKPAFVGRASQSAVAAHHDGVMNEF